jgi:hypothetical protein
LESDAPIQTVEKQPRLNDEGEENNALRHTHRRRALAHREEAETTSVCLVESGATWRNMVTLISPRPPFATRQPPATGHRRSTRQPANKDSPNRLVRRPYCLGTRRMTEVGDEILSLIAIHSYTRNPCLLYIKKDINVYVSM